MDDTTAAGIIRAFATSRWSMPIAADETADPEAEGDGSGLDLARALFIAADALETRARLAARRHPSLPRNAGKPWSAGEDERLLAAFDNGTTVEALAGAHERTRAGIEARLVKHGRLEEHNVRGGLGLRYTAKERSPPG
jgi:hypothetical protein